MCASCHLGACTMHPRCTVGGGRVPKWMNPTCTASRTLVGDPSPRPQARVNSFDALVPPEPHLGPTATHSPHKTAPPLHLSLLLLLTKRASPAAGRWRPRAWRIVAALEACTRAARCRAAADGRALRCCRAPHRCTNTSSERIASPRTREPAARSRDRAGTQRSAPRVEALRAVGRPARASSMRWGVGAARARLSTVRPSVTAPSHDDTTHERSDVTTIILCTEYSTFLS